MAVSSQNKDFSIIEDVLSNALLVLSTYYDKNCLRPNPTKTISSLFHLNNKKANYKLQVYWNGELIEFSNHPKYLGVTLDRTLSYKQHIANTRSKASSRNNLLQKLTCSKWGANPHTLRTSALALTFSAAEYAAPVWERSSHAKKLDPIINQACRIITGCLKPTYTGHLYILSGIAPPNIRRSVTSMLERHKQQSDLRHPLYGKEAASARLRSRRSFLRSVPPLINSVAMTRKEMWQISLSIRDKEMLMSAEEHLPPGSEEHWTTWKTLNRLRTKTGRCKTNLVRWGYHAGSDLCTCGQPQTMDHLTICTNLRSPCSPEDLAEASAAALGCAEYWAPEI